MDAMRSIRQAGLVVGALLLVVPAAEASDVRREGIPGSSQLRIHYTDAASAVDRVQLQPSTSSTDDQTIVFAVQAGGAPVGSGGNPCDPPDTARECVATNVARLLLEPGGGDDVFDLHLLPAPGSDQDRAIPSTMNGGPGNDTFTGSVNEDIFDGGPGDDTLHGLSGPDRFVGGAGTDTLLLSAGGPWVVTLDGIPNDGVVTEAESNVATDVETLIGGPDGDTLTGTAGSQTVAGGDGNDVLDAGADPDNVGGGAGADVIAARDGAADSILCGDGTDSVMADWNDNVHVDCENVSRSVRDDDGDGAAHDADCNDANPAIKPGGGDIPGNGVDEDCDGVDAVTDRDGDGVSAGADCNDANAAIRPGAVDVPGNRIDEDCSGADAQRTQVAGTFASGWSVFPRWTVITKLTLKGAPAGARLQVRCAGKGCPAKRRTVKLKAGGANLTKLFKRARLRPGAVVELRLTAPGAIGKVLRVTVRKGKAPKRSSLCLPPGASKAGKC